MSRVDDLLRKYSNFQQPSSNLVQTETYTSNVNRASNAFDRYNVAPQNLSVPTNGYTNHGTHGRFGTTELIDRSNHLNDSRGNRLGTQDLINRSTHLNNSLGGSNLRNSYRADNNINTNFQRTDTIPLSSAPKSSLDGLVTVVAQSAEMERLNQKVRNQNSLLSQPIPKRQIGTNYDQDELSRENHHLKTQHAAQDNDFNFLEEENYKLKDRERQLKDRLAELSDENKRLLAMQVQRGKGGAWCC